ncbi:RNA polymerase sigma factor [Candidatus Uhrbacteria bacterium]|nr:RNA polymerase sigma factor [Candidatus Uhrbacteria bacterium]
MHNRHKFLLFRVYRFRDTQAYGELYEVYVARIRRFVAFRVKSSQDAEDLTAEVFLRGWEYATSSMIEKPSALFYRIARNVVVDHYRAKERLGESATMENAHLVVDKKPIASEQMELDEDRAELLSAMQLIKEEYRDALMMRYMDEMSVKEIAQALEKTPNNVRVLLHRAKKALERVIETKK